MSTKLPGTPRARCAGRGLIRQPDYEAEQGQGMVATRHERQRKSFCGVRPVHGTRADSIGGPIERITGGNLFRIALAQRQSRHGRGSVRSLQQARVQPVSRFAKRIEATRVARAGFAGRPRVLERDGVDGPIRRGESRLPYIADLVARKLAGPEDLAVGQLLDSEIAFHESEYQRLRGELQSAHEVSQLPEAPSDKTAGRVE